MRFQDIAFGMFVLILAYLIFTNWRGANALVSTAAGATVSGIKALQGR